MPTLGQLLADFEAMTLDSLDAVALLNRFDRKYLLAASQLQELLQHLRREYRILEIDGRRLHQYRTLYFDTPAFDLYHRHHADEPIRHKIRSRQYVDSALSFFEVKTRDAQGRTVKARLRTDAPLTSLTPEARALLAVQVPPDEQRVGPKLQNDFQRVTLVGRHTPERLTLDLGIQFTHDNRTAGMPGVVIAEVKQRGRATASAFVQLLAERDIASTSISKYCLGVAMLVPGIGRAAFESKLQAIEALASGPLMAP